MFKKYTIPYHLDDPRATLAHRDIILNKPFLKQLYLDWYNEFRKRTAGVKGKIVEIGSGGGFIKDVWPDVITSDILDLPNVDQVFSAEEMPFGNGELGALLMLNVFHHIPRPYLFLKEAGRCLSPGGRVVMVEPANSALSRFVYKRFHHEPFDEKGDREIQPGNPLSNSNQALPHIYFERDAARFAEEFPSLRIREISYHTPFAYVISGGVSRSAMLPFFMYRAVRAFEWMLGPFRRQLALFCTIELEKV